MGTYSNQSKLPRLPIPTLEDTCERFPRTLWALQTREQRQATKRVVQEFLTGDGPKLQKLLAEYDEQGKSSPNGPSSYVEEFWSDAYLSPDSAVVLNLNPFFLLEDGPDPHHNKNQIGRAAQLVFAALKFASLLKSEELSPDLFRDHPLCMDQFKAILGSYRAPCDDKDIVECDPESSHVVVMKKNRMYYFKALWPDGTVAVNTDDIIEILDAIDKDLDGANPEDLAKNALGVLTTLDRRSWSTARRNLLSSSEHNNAALQVVDSALFVLALDDFVPCDVHEAAANMLHGTYKLETNRDLVDYQAGTCLNRWYDKLQVIVCGDGTAGVNFEHSAVDGHSALRFASDIFTETVVSFAQSITKTIYGGDRVPSVLNAPVRRAAAVKGQRALDTRPKRLEFELPASIVNQIFYAETGLGDHIVTSETYALEFEEFGKTLIKANNMSPDSFVQMSILVAYFRLYGKLVCAYEPVLTKRFLHGRTEAMRSTTPKAALLCETWCSQFSPEKEKIAALVAATKEHSSVVKQAACGKGVERHLFALKCIAEKNGVPVPNFFSSDAWKLLNHTVLSTSNCGNPSLRHFGFGPVVPDGFGIGYIIKDNGIQYACSSKCRQTQRYVHTLRQFLHEVKNYLSPANTMEVTGYGEFLNGQQENMVNNIHDLEYVEDFEVYGEGPQPPKDDSPRVGVALPIRRPQTSPPKSTETTVTEATPLTRVSSYLKMVRRRASVGDLRLMNVGVDVLPRPSIRPSPSM